MSILAKELKKAAATVRAGLAKREIIEQSNRFLFVKDRLVTYDDEISISTPIEGLEAEGTASLPALFQFLSSERYQKQVTSAANVLTFVGSVRWRLELETLCDSIKDCLKQMGMPKKWFPIPTGFIDSLKMTIPWCAQDKSRPQLTCVHVRKDGLMEASESLHIMRVHLNPMPVESFLLSAKVAKQLVRFNVQTMATTADWMHFREDSGTVFSCRFYEGEFPDVSKYFHMEGRQSTLPRRTVYMDRMILGSSECVNVTLSDSCIKFTADNWEHVAAIYPSSENEPAYVV